MGMKGQAGGAESTAIALVFIAVTMIIGIFVFASLSTLVPTSPGTVANGTESISGSTNTSAHFPIIAVSGVEMLNGTACATPACYNVTLETGEFELNADAASVGVWIAYTYEHGLWIDDSGARSVVGNINTTAYSGFNLLVILVIVIAAAAVMGGIYLLRKD